MLSPLVQLGAASVALQTQGRSRPQAVNQSIIQQRLRLRTRLRRERNQHIVPCRRSRVVVKLKVGLELSPLESKPIAPRIIFIAPEGSEYPSLNECVFFNTLNTDNYPSCSSLHALPCKRSRWHLTLLVASLQPNCFAHGKRPYMHGSSWAAGRTSIAKPSTKLTANHDLLQRSRTWAGRPPKAVWLGLLQSRASGHTDMWLRRYLVAGMPRTSCGQDCRLQNQSFFDNA